MNRLDPRGLPPVDPRDLPPARTQPVLLGLLLLFGGLAAVGYLAAADARTRPPGIAPASTDSRGRPGSAARAEAAARDRRLSPADDGQRLLIRDVEAVPAHISPGTSPRSQDSTSISYLVVAPDTINVAIYLDEIVGDSLTGQFVELQNPGTRRAPRGTPYIRVFNGYVNEVPVADGTYQLTIRAADDTGRVEEERRPLEIDTVPPRLLTPIVEANGQSVFRNGDTIVLDARLDRPEYLVTADFSTLDSDLDPALTTVFDHGDGRYTIHHRISPVNERNDGQARRVRLTFRDLAGNSLVDTSRLFCLSNAPPRLLSARYLPGEVPIYRNGGIVRIETAWASNAGPLTIAADFRSVDSRYDSTRVAVTERDDNVFELSYEIDPDNERPDRPDYRVRLLAHDIGCGTTMDTSLTIALDNARGDTPTLIEPVTATRLAVLSVPGRASGNASVIVRRGTVPLDTAAVAEDGRFTAVLSLVAGENALTAEAFDLAGNKSAALTFSIFRVTEAFLTLPARYEPADLIRVAPTRRADRLRMEFWTLGGDLVQVLEDSQGGELFDLSWDGRNRDGIRVNSGPLLALVHIDYPGGDSETLKRAFILVAQ